MKMKKVLIRPAVGLQIRPNGQVPVTTRFIPRRDTDGHGGCAGSVATEGHRWTRRLRVVEHPCPFLFHLMISLAQPPCPSVFIRGHKSLRSLRVHPCLSVAINRCAASVFIRVLRVNKQRAASVSICVPPWQRNPVQPLCPSVSLRGTFRRCSSAKQAGVV